MNAKTFLITGATSGIGRHAALHLAARGHHVLATGRNREALDALARDAAGARLEVFVLDVTSAASIANAVTEVARRTAGRGLDVLVNNAGYGLYAPLEMATDDDVRKQFDTNVFGLLAMTRAFLPAMRERRRGRIINVSSIGGRIAVPLGGAYTASKHAVEAISDALRMELKPFGVDVVMIEPGIVRSDFVARTVQLLESYSDASSPYARAIERANAVTSRVDRIAVSPRATSLAIERAATARTPRARYIAPFRTYFMLGFVRLAPTRLVDWILRSFFGLTSKVLRTSRAIEVVPGQHTA